LSDDFAAIRYIDWKKMRFLSLGIVLFTVVYWAPAWPYAVDPMGKHFLLTPEAKGAIAVFLRAGTWWVFEVVPIGVLQALFLIRPARDAFAEFMVPSVLFIVASIMIGLVFTKTGLIRRLAYQMTGQSSSVNKPV
jgi:sodium-dependent dicarboxylate transporter 2/3/5